MKSLDFLFKIFLEYLWDRIGENTKYKNLYKVAAKITHPPKLWMHEPNLGGKENGGDKQTSI